MKRLLSVLLLLAMLVTTLVACGGETGKGGDETSTSADNGGAETTPAETQTTEYLAAQDLDGYVFRWLAGKNFTKITYDEEELDKTSIVVQAQIKRDAEVKDKFNVDFEDIDADLDNEISSYVLKDAMMTESSYDVGAVFSTENISSLITNDAVMDVREIPYIDLTQEWYSQQANEEYSIMGKQLCVAGAFPSLPGTGAFIFNKQMMSELQLDLPYDIIFDGLWTIETLLEYTSAAYVDIDGVAGPSDGDKFGYSGHTVSVSYFYQGMGGPTTTRDENGAVVPVLSNDTADAIFDKVKAFRDNPNHMLNTKMGVDDPTSSHRIFYDGNSLFCYWITGTLSYHDIDTFDYGLAILPKYDEDQDNYCMPTVGGIKIFPNNIGEVEKAGLIYEALCEASWRHTYPASIKEAADFEYLRDEESIEMRKLIDQSLTYDILKNCDPSGGQLASCAFITYCLNNNVSLAIAAAGAQAGLELQFHNFFYGEG